MLCIFLCFLFLLSPYIYFGHNQGCKYKKNPTLEIYCKVNLNCPPSHCRVQDVKKQKQKNKKNKVMCNDPCISVCTLSRACRSICQKCSMIWIINPVPPLFCKEIFVSHIFRKHNTLHIGLRTYSCVCSPQNRIQFFSHCSCECCR